MTKTAKTNKIPENKPEVDITSELTADLQRLQADFENYRKRIDIEKENLSASVRASTIVKLLPVVDNIDRALSHMPPELQGNKWAEGVMALRKNLEASLKSLGVERINASAGTPFDANLHEAVMMEEDGDGDNEIISAELQAGYCLNGTPIRHSMVKVKHG